MGYCEGDDKWCPLQESNLQLALRRGSLYPFNYGGLCICFYIIGASRKLVNISISSPGCLTISLPPMAPPAKLVNGFLCSGPFRMNMRIPSIAYLTKKKHASLHPWEYAEREISMGRCSNRTSFSIERSRCRPKKEKDFSPS